MGQVTHVLQFGVLELTVQLLGDDSQSTQRQQGQRAGMKSKWAIKPRGTQDLTRLAGAVEKSSLT